MSTTAADAERETVHLQCRAARGALFSVFIRNLRRSKSDGKAMKTGLRSTTPTRQGDDKIVGAGTTDAHLVEKKRVPCALEGIKRATPSATTSVVPCLGCVPSQLVLCTEPATAESVTESDTPPWREMSARRDRLMGWPARERIIYGAWPKPNRKAQVFGPGL